MALIHNNKYNYYRSKVHSVSAHDVYYCWVVCSGYDYFVCKIKSWWLCVVFRSEAVEKNAMLRTKAMREREEQRERRKYNYTLLRIRLPDGNILQGLYLPANTYFNVISRNS